jgi:transcriptional regulator with XRE-family HTH domain
MRNAVSRLLDGRGWTDGQLATRAGLDRAHVNQVKNGRAEPTVATALAIARALRVPVAVAFPPGSSARRKAGLRPRCQWNATATAVSTSANDTR